MVAGSDLPVILLDTMRNFAAGHWGASVGSFREDAYLTAFLDDQLQAVLGWETSPLMLKGHLGLSRYTGTVSANIEGLTYDLVSSARLDGHIATEVAWQGVVRATGKAIQGFTCTSWALTPDRTLFQGLTTTSWTMVGQSALVALSER